MAYMMVMDRAADGCVTWHTGDVSLIPNFINKTTLDKSWIPLVYENLFKTFCFCLYCSLDTSLSLSLSHDVDFCDVIKKPGGGYYVNFCLFKAFRTMKLGIRLTSPVCHVTHPSTARSIIIMYLLLTVSTPHLLLIGHRQIVLTQQKRYKKAENW